MIIKVAIYLKHAQLMAPGTYPWLGYSGHRCFFFMAVGHRHPFPEHIAGVRTFALLSALPRFSCVASVVGSFFLWTKRRF